MTDCFYTPLERTWYGTNGLKDGAADALQLIKQAMRGRDWDFVIQTLTKHPSFANAIFPLDREQSTLLHAAVKWNAPPAFVEGLVQLGLPRSVRDIHGRQAYEVAAARGHEQLVPLLLPKPVIEVDEQELARIGKLFHGLLRSFMVVFEPPSPTWLPQLSILTEAEQVRVWFPISGMAGGCRFWLEKTKVEPALLIESWSRLSDSRATLHRISPWEIVIVREKLLSIER